MLRVLILALGLLNTLAGAALAAAATTGDWPSATILTGLALFAQGAYSLLYLGLLEHQGLPLFRATFVAGHGAAILVGGFGFLSTALTSFRSRLGPDSIGLLGTGFCLLTLGLVALIFDGRRSPTGPGEWTWK